MLTQNLSTDKYLPCAAIFTPLYKHVNTLLIFAIALDIKY